jgi:hypothetical protein
MGVLLLSSYSNAIATTDQIPNLNVHRHGEKEEGTCAKWYTMEAEALLDTMISGKNVSIE